jgi:hypothetical protein
LPADRSRVLLACWRYRQPKASQTAQTAESLPNVGSCLDFPVLPDDPFVRAELCQRGARSSVAGDPISGSETRPMRLTKILLATVTALLCWPFEASAQTSDPTISERIAALASYTEMGPSCHNPCPAEDTSCGGGYCGACSHCCKRMDLWASTEVLLWWGKGSYTPALVTTSPDGTPQADAGVLPDAEILEGAEYLGNSMQVGGRVALGIWLDPEHNVTAAGRFYGTGGDSSNFQASSEGSPILARPFYNALLGQNDALLIAFDDGGTDLVDGSVSTEYSNQNFLGAEAYFEVMMDRNQNRRINVLAGYQFMRLDDGLIIDSTHVARQQNDLIFDIRDRFSTLNEFHGGQIGVRAQMMRGCWSIDALTKLALGVTQQQVTIAGSTNQTPGGTLDGGLLAQETNIGTYSRDRFGFIPEFTCNLKYHFTPNFNVHVGYTIIWWADVVTSGRQIDTQVNLTQLTGPLVGPARPRFEFEDESYWMQGINFGMTWDF